MEILQSIKQSEMSPMLGRIYKSEGGMDSLDVLMKYLYVSNPLQHRISGVAVFYGLSPATAHPRISGCC